MSGPSPNSAYNIPLMDLKTLETKKISDLRIIAQSLGIDAGSLKKNELIAAIGGNTQQAETPVVAVEPSINERATTNTDSPEVRKRGRKPRIIAAEISPAEVSSGAEQSTRAEQSTPVQTEGQVQQRQRQLNININISNKTSSSKTNVLSSETQIKILSNVNTHLPLRRTKKSSKKIILT
ncbi:MAG: hypothetical protein RL349_1525 [Bacteroidota bacterium]